jgi:hypothetical protein
MKFTRRKFIQSLALVCAAPVISKIEGIVSIDTDSCIDIIQNDNPGEWYNFLKENLSKYCHEIMLTDKEFGDIISEI